MESTPFLTVCGGSLVVQFWGSFYGPVQDRVTITITQLLIERFGNNFRIQFIPLCTGVDHLILPILPLVCFGSEIWSNW